MVGLWLAFLLVCGPSEASASARVLGPEAGPPLRAWVTGLGLESRGIAVGAARADVTLSKRCTLTLSHGTKPACSDAHQHGDIAVCWVGSGCPRRASRRAALKRAGPLSLPWRDAGPRSDDDRGALLTLRQSLQRHLLRGDHEAAREVLRGLVGRRDVRPIDWLSLAPMLAWAGEAKSAWAIATDGRLDALGAPRVATLRALLLIGPEAGRSVAEAVMAPESACQMTAFAWTLLAMRHYASAGTLAASIRGRAPECFDAYAIETEAWTVLRRLPDQKRVAEAALARFKGDERLGPIEEAYLVDHGQAEVVKKRLEARIAAGDAEAGVLKRLLSFYIAVEGRVERLERFRARADKDPSDIIANFFAGVLLHYEKGFVASTAYLKRVIGKVSDEPRLYIYLAMNAFNLGDRPSAERFISKAETLDLEDPDVPYCISEIFRDSDRARAVAAVERYWEMTRFTSDVTSVKQQRVWRMKGALKRCLAEDTPVPCPGPWEHTFDSVALGMYPDAPQPSEP